MTVPPGPAWRDVRLRFARAAPACREQPCACGLAARARQPASFFKAALLDGRAWAAARGERGERGRGTGRRVRSGSFGMAAGGGHVHGQGEVVHASKRTWCARGSRATISPAESDCESGHRGDSASRGRQAPFRHRGSAGTQVWTLGLACACDSSLLATGMQV